MVTGIAKGAPVLLAMSEMSGPGPSVPVPAARMSTEISSSSAISAVISSTFEAGAVQALRLQPRDLARKPRRLFEHGVGFRLGLRLHQVADAEPLLVGRRADDIEDDQGGAVAHRAARGEIDRLFEFRAVIGDDEIFRAMTRLERAPALQRANGHVCLRSAATLLREAMLPKLAEKGKVS